MADVGSIVNGRYEILGVISQGGLSTVYMAVNRKSNRMWAIKEIRSTPGRGGEGQKAAALMEAMLTSKLTHPSIPRIEEVFETRDAFYIVMRYLAGRTLEETVNEFGPMWGIDAARIGIRLCDVLGYLHSLPVPIIFCDLKPSNVILADREVPDIKLFDFGAARVYEEREVPNAVRFGTTGFTAPELIAGSGRADARADIYSLGAVLSVLIRKSGLAEGSSLKTVLQRCLKNDPQERYANCAEVRSALEKYLAEEGSLRSLETGYECSGNHSTVVIGKTIKLGPTAQLGVEKIVLEQPSGSEKQKIGFHPNINILVCDATNWL